MRIGSMDSSGTNDSISTAFAVGSGRFASSASLIGMTWSFATS